MNLRMYLLKEYSGARDSLLKAKVVEKSVEGLIPFKDRHLLRFETEPEEDDFEVTRNDIDSLDMISTLSKDVDNTGNLDALIVDYLANDNKNDNDQNIIDWCENNVIDNNNKKWISLLPTTLNQYFSCYINNFKINVSSRNSCMTNNSWFLYPNKRRIPIRMHPAKLKGIIHLQYNMKDYYLIKIQMVKFSKFRIKYGHLYIIDKDQCYYTHQYLNPWVDIYDIGSKLVVKKSRFKNELLAVPLLR